MKIYIQIILIVIFSFTSCKKEAPNNTNQENENTVSVKKMPVKFNLMKKTEGQYMIGEYSEYYEIALNDCKVKTKKSNNQVKYQLIDNSKNYGDWNNDGHIDYEFMFSLNGDSETKQIVYALISDCEYHQVVNDFFYDEETFEEEYDVSHIKNIKSPKDYYRRNFEYELNHNPKLDSKLKKHMIETFKKFVEGEKYKE